MLLITSLAMRLEDYVISTVSQDLGLFLYTKFLPAYTYFHISLPLSCLHFYYNSRSSSSRGDRLFALYFETGSISSVAFVLQMLPYFPSRGDSGS